MLFLLRPQWDLIFLHRNLPHVEAVTPDPPKLPPTPQSGINPCSRAERHHSRAARIVGSESKMTSLSLSHTHTQSSASHQPGDPLVLSDTSPQPPLPSGDGSKIVFNKRHIYSFKGNFNKAVWAARLSFFAPFIPNWDACVLLPALMKL